MSQTDSTDKKDEQTPNATIKQKRDEEVFVTPKCSIARRRGSFVNRANLSRSEQGTPHPRKNSTQQKRKIMIDNISNCESFKNKKLSKFTDTNPYEHLRGYDHLGSPDPNFLDQDQAEDQGKLTEKVTGNTTYPVHGIDQKFQSRQRYVPGKTGSNTQDSKSMTFISYNAEGFREHEISTLIKKLKPGALLLQESKLSQNLLEKKRELINEYVLEGTSNESGLSRRQRLNFMEYRGISTIISTNQHKNTVKVKVEKGLCITHTKTHKIKIDDNTHVL